MPNKILLATAKGVVVYQRSNTHWKFEQTHFLGMAASQVFIDPRNGAWWVSLAHKHWGQKLHYSLDEGTTWKEVATPKYPDGAEITPGKPAVLKYIWSIASGGDNKPERIWVGTDPGGLFLSEDYGKSFVLNQPLWQHPSRPDHWFGGGRDNAGIHSIAIDPRDSDHFYIGISCAGVFETFDSGASWNSANAGLKADYLPNPNGQYGHDPHAIRICTSNPDIIWQQNHCGIFRSTDAGKNWTDLSDKKQLAHYGFALAIDQQNPNEAWVIPAVSDQMRVAPNFSLNVCHTSDGGNSWHQLNKGLPQGGAFDIVLRHGLDIFKDEMVFGTNTGNLFYSADRGHSWQSLNNYLPTIFAVSFA
ncbi:MAG: glycosyl hydrolase [Cyclobacteriaceae bacterium]